MARPIRLELPGALYHVSAHGNGEASIFQDDTDRQGFLELLEEVVERYQWICHAYCLMGDNYQLLVETPDPNLSDGMRRLGGIYTQRFNKRHGRSGTLFKGRYKAILADKQEYLAGLCRTIILNPVREGLVNRPEDFKWSSYLATIGSDKRPSFLDTGGILDQFGSFLREAREDFQQFIQAGMSEEPRWQRPVGQMILGGKRFLESMIPYLEKHEALHDLTEYIRQLSRPSLEELIPVSFMDNKRKRNLAIVGAHLEHGYTQDEIAAHTRMHRTWISRLISRAIKKQAQA